MSWRGRIWLKGDLEVATKPERLEGRMVYLTGSSMEDISWLYIRVSAENTLSPWGAEARPGIPRSETARDRPGMPGGDTA